MTEQYVDIRSYRFFQKLTELPFVDEIWLYGSRAKGQAKGPESDIDLCLICPKATTEDWFKVTEIIEEADTLHKIDCVRYEDLEMESLIHQEIFRNRTVLWERSHTDLPIIEIILKERMLTIDALCQLKIAVDTQHKKNRLIIAGAIQYFEFTYESFWKLIKRIAEAQSITVKSPRDAIAYAYQMGWILDEKMWLSILKDRNLTTHTYKQTQADLVYFNLKDYAHEFEAVLSRIDQSPLLQRIFADSQKQKGR